MSDLYPGELVNNRFVIIRKLGEVGFGKVFHAFDVDSRSSVAFKLIPDWEIDIGTIANEFSLLKSIDHPNIMKVIEFVPSSSESNRNVLVSQFIEGLNLENALQSKRINKGWFWRLSVLRKLASGLARMHADGILHADLKPANIVLAAENQPVIIDFGLAKRLNVKEKHVGNSNNAFDTISNGGGTRCYYSPERFDGDLPQSSDVYAFGLILFEVINGYGKQPLLNFPHDLFVFGDYGFSKKVSEKLNDIYKTATAITPSHRYRSGQDLFTEISKAVDVYELELDSGFYSQEQGSEKSVF